MIYESPIKNPYCSEFEVDKNLISKFVIENLIPLKTPYPLDELMLMTAAVCRFTPKKIIEWGTSTGYSARIFYETIKGFGLDCEIHSIDLPDDVIHPEHDPKTVGLAIKGVEYIRLHKGDCIDVASNILSPKDDVLFFVDGDHSYESVKKELDWITKCFPGSAILAHDTFFQSGESGYNIGPIRAVLQVATTQNYRVINMDVGAPGMVLMYKK